MALEGASPDLALVFVSATPPIVTDVLTHVHAALGAKVMLGSGVAGVIGGETAVEEGVAVSVWLAVMPEARLRAFHLEVIRTPESTMLLGVPPVGEEDLVGLVISDPWSFPADPFRDPKVAGFFADLPIIGGFVSGGARRGDSRLMVNGKMHDRGAVGVVLGGNIGLRVGLAQGCRPIGHPMTVTAADADELFLIAGEPALNRAREAVASLPEEERALAVRGLSLGVEVGGSSDFAVRGIRGADEEYGSIAASEPIGVGELVQFHLRDADYAAEELLEASRSMRGCTGVLMFTCTGRGRAMFPTTDHDPAALRGEIGPVPVGGFFAAGEYGPLGNGSQVHSLSAAMLGFYDSEVPKLDVVRRNTETVRPPVAAPDDISSLLD